MNRTVVGLGLALSLLITPAAQAQSAPGAVREGYTLLERGWVNDAIATFQRAVQRYPQSVEGRLGLAIAYQRAGQDANAWDAYQRVLQIASNERKALAALGELGGYRSEWNAGGIAALTQLLTLEPENQAARTRRATLYSYQGQFAEAIADYEQVLPQNPAPDIVLAAAQTYTYSGDYSQGLALFDRYRTGNRAIPDSAVTAYALALQETGQSEQAIALLEPRLQARRTLDATAIQLRAALATAYHANGQSEQAIAILAPLRNREDSTLTLARTLSSIGRQSDNGGLYDEAIALYRQVLQRTSSPSTGLLIETADVLSESPSGVEQALTIYQQLLQQQPQNQSLQAKQLILEYQVGMRSREDLTQALQQALQPLPDSAAAQRPIAQALITLDPPEAELLPIYEDLASAGVPFLLFRVAQIHLQQNDLASAEQAIAAYRSTPAGQVDPATELILAEVERREGKLEASAQRYTTLIATAPRGSILDVALRGLASIRVTQGNLDEARSIYEELLTRNPQDLLAQLGQANLDYQAQTLSEADANAILKLWLASEASPDIPPEVLNLAAALPASADREPLYRVLLEANPNNTAIQRRWVQLLASRDPDQATQYLDTLIARSPQNLDLYFVKGELAQTLGELDQAVAAYETILEQEPENRGALSALGGVRFQQRRFAEATALYNTVIALNPSDRDARRILAELSLAQDQPLKALEQFRQLQTELDAAGTSDPALDARISQIQTDLMRRRGFQPSWERY
jgi:tetratricopeptide (TPR) repeat protein